MSQLIPVGSVIFIHCCAPTEYVVTGKKCINDCKCDCHHRDIKKCQSAFVKIIDVTTTIAEHFLDHVPEWTIPCVNRNTHLNTKPDIKQNECRSPNRPLLPF